MLKRRNKIEQSKETLEFLQKGHEWRGGTGTLKNKTEGGNIFGHAHTSS